jgi:SAM-dependent methyltransferase
MGHTLRGRLRAGLILLGAAAAVALTRHGFRAAGGHRAPGGILVRDAGAYNAFSRRLLGPFFEQIADDVAEAAPGKARILEVGCGPGHLSIQLARWHGLDVTGIDLDPAMIDQAQANATGSDGIDGSRPSFEVGDVAHLVFPDESFDLVISTLSMHHWGDPSAGLSEVGRVLGPGGRALIWDFRPGIWPLRRHIPDLVKHAQGSRLQIVGATPWRWPWKLSLTQRVELARPEEPPRHSETQTGKTPSDIGEAHG